MKDLEYIRSQAIERFDRGLYYAEIGRLDAARERFLVALRYRVMDCGSLHPDVAATHEMLGHVEYFLAENLKNDSFEGNLVRLDEGDDGLLGGNLTIMEHRDKNGQSFSSSQGKSHYEKAAMHYQTALDILDAKELDINNEKASTWMNGESTKDETEFHWKELAETYSALDKKGRLGVEQRIDIVARIHERMDELPVTVGEKSYATSFLSTFYE
jgi:tetratricopeptide (TPR) repeat protein